MLKLKKLQILGFKSFCDRTELKFHGEGIAAIVGPNGCGKSNLSDAISWVLGEQSAKSLRGVRMEDVIFSGTPTRKATGMAEVSLTLIDPEIYAGDSTAEPEIEITDELPEDDWDEAALRAAREAETDQAAAELQPGQGEQGEAQAGATTGQEGSVARGADEPSATPTGEPILPSEVGAASPHGEVVLKIRRRKFQRSFTAGEIHITRRLFRTGESEYLLNGKLCRLRDIQDIFMGTGLGPESYAIIEQGRIGQILSNKPTERRAIIEEAAGITKYKARKRLAEARLEDARQNLARVNDIFEEVTRQMNSLKRQASKAERYARLRDEMRSKLRLVLASKFAKLQRERGELQAELEQLASAVQQQGDAVRALETEHAGRTQRGYAIETESRQNRERLAEITREVDHATARQRHNEERCTELAARAVTADSELGQTVEKLATLEAERDANRQILQSAAADVSAAQQEAAAVQQQVDGAAAALAEVERQQEQRRVAVMQAAAAASGVRNQITQAEERIAGLEREARRLGAEISTARTQVDTFGGQRGQIAFEFESATQRVAALATQILDGRKRLEEARQAETASKRRLDTLRAEHATVLGKKASIEALIAEHGYSTDSVRRLFQSGALQGGHAPAGVLADFLEVEDRYEHVVDDFLRDELNYIVVKSWDAADEGLRLLQTNVDGRATFLVHPSDAQARFSFVLDEATHPAPRPHDQITPLKSTIKVLNGFGKSLEVILPKLRDGYIVPDPRVARELALENPDAFFLAETGDCFHNVTVTGGKQRNEGPLSMKRELRDISRQLFELENSLREEQHRAGKLAREITELTSLLERLEQEKREAEKAALTSGHSLRQLEGEMDRLRQRLEVHERELRQISGGRAEQQDLIAARAVELAAAEERRDRLEQEMTAAQESLPVLRQAREAAAQAGSEMLARVAVMEERQRAASAALQRIELLAAEVAGRVDALRSQISSSGAERLEREGENVELATQVIALGEERTAAEAKEQALAAESAEVRARLVQIEDELKEARTALDLARDRRGEVAAQAARLESDQQHMDETAMNEVGVALPELAADPTLAVVEGEQLAAEETAYRDMRAKLDSMGPVNMMALEEYNETRQRHEFLDTQRKDLLESIENTVNTIREIETVSRQKFEEAFHRINDNFQAAFKKLFGGGTAFMRLTDEENSAESGIDIVASPPGKKLQNVLLLSGGEKALTALSLLVGIFQYQPSPFCILDEVDAPLDEANVGRFTELVREMSVQTQFVLITHSKKTMSIAPVLYGVTMQEPGVSRLVSVRFHEDARAS